MVVSNFVSNKRKKEKEKGEHAGIQARLQRRQILKAKGWAAGNWWVPIHITKSRKQSTCLWVHHQQGCNGSGTWEALSCFIQQDWFSLRWTNYHHSDSQDPWYFLRVFCSCSTPIQIVILSMSLRAIINISYLMTLFVNTGPNTVYTYYIYSFIGQNHFLFYWLSIQQLSWLLNLFLQHWHVKSEIPQAFFLF